MNNAKVLSQLEKFESRKLGEQKFVNMSMTIPQAISMHKTLKGLEFSAYAAEKKENN